MPADSRRFHCPMCRTELSLPAASPALGQGRRWRVGLVLLGIVLFGLLLFAYRTQGQILTILDLANEVTGSMALSVAALVLAALGAGCLAGWLLLPFLLAWAYLDLRRRLGGSRPCPFPVATPVPSPAVAPPSSPPPSPGPPSP